mgnify:CR=1 FL=1
MERPTTIEQIEFGLRAIIDNPDFAMTIKQYGYRKGIEISSCESDATVSKVGGLPAFDYYEEVQALGHQEVESGEFDDIKYDGKAPTVEQKKAEHQEINDNNPYESGVHKKINTFLSRQGWIAEWQNPEAVMIVKS